MTGDNCEELFKSIYNRVFHEQQKMAMLASKPFLRNAGKSSCEQVTFSWV